MTGPDSSPDGDGAGTATADAGSDGPTVLVVDNYDSFAYNLVQYLGEAVATDALLPGVTDGEVVVRRNDAVDVAGIRAIDPDAVVVSPGPGTPRKAGVSVPIFADLEYPTLGVCLGHQALCSAAGAPVGHAEAVVHGKPSTVEHDGRGIFEGLPERFEVGRYHSLAVERADLPDELEESARTDGVPARAPSGGSPGERSEPDGVPASEASGGSSDAGASGDEAEVVMAVRHRDRPHVGVQFHPESILTDHGKRLVEAFCRKALEGSL